MVSVMVMGLCTAATARDSVFMAAATNMATRGSNQSRHVPSEVTPSRVMLVLRAPNAVQARRRRNLISVSAQKDFSMDVFPEVSSNC